MEPSCADSSRSSLLLIDDDPGSIQVLSKMLSGLGELRFATSGERGLHLARSHPPDLILLDIEMPGLGGESTFKALRAEPSLAEIPVIFVTSHVDAETESKMLQLGAADFIGKPFNLLVVQARVRTQLRLSQLTAELRAAARKDGLTNIANRRAFDEAFFREWARSNRLRSPLSLVMIDVDHFKLYNDCRGHVAGDFALRSVADCLSKSVHRPNDLVARFGGEEFVVLLPDTPTDGAAQIAEQMRAAVEALRISHPASPTAACLTISAGTCTWSATERLEAWIGREILVLGADEALYAAKRGGRNRVNIGTPRLNAPSPEEIS